MTIVLRGTCSTHEDNPTGYLGHQVSQTLKGRFIVWLELITSPR